MNYTKKFHTFFKNDNFYLLYYSNGLAEFRTKTIEDGFIKDSNLELMEDEYGECFVYTIDAIYDLAELVKEITQHDVFTIKSDVLFSLINRKNEQKI
jgi:hypothetical protein